MTLPAPTKSNSALAVTILLLLSIFVIFYRFTGVPKNVTFDEIEFAKLALSLGTHSYIPYSPLATGHATMYFYILLFSLKLFGITSFGLRIVSAVFGVATIALSFFVLKKVASKMNISHAPSFLSLLPIIGVFLFTTTRWFFNFARFGFEGTFLLFLELTSLYFLLRFSDRREDKWLIPSGIFAGLAYNSYQPGRIFFLIPLFFIFLTMLEKKQTREDFSFFTKHAVVTFLSFLVPFIICITPLSYYLSQNTDVRISQLSYVTNTEMNTVEKMQFFGRNVASTALMFSVKGDVNGRHNYPNKSALNPIMSVLFWSGLILAFWNIKNKMNQLFIFYFFIALFPTLFTYPWENPNMLRTITCLPSLIYFCCYALGQGYVFAEKRLHLTLNVVTISIFILISLSAVYDLRTYYVFQAPVFSEAFEAQMPLEYYISNPDAKIKK